MRVEDYLSVYVKGDPTYAVFLRLSFIALESVDLNSFNFYIESRHRRVAYAESPLLHFDLLAL